MPRAIASLTEAYMRPLYQAKADRLDVKADEITSDGRTMLDTIRTADEPGYLGLKRLIAHS